MSDDVTPLTADDELNRSLRALHIAVDTTVANDVERVARSAIAMLQARLATAEAVVEEFRKPEYHDHRANHVFPCRACAVLATHDATRTKETSR